uniref:Protein FAM136A n=3 Tax=Latimeria chalumnae TaxID=7897 RepID=H3BEQ8_LATCH
MEETQQVKVQNAVEEMVQGLEREMIRKMQREMFQCSADCCDNRNASMGRVHQCIEKCHTPLARAQAVVTSELERFQDRFTRCTMQCSDQAKDSFDSGTKETVVKQQLGACVTKCVDDHVNLIPSMTRRLKESLTSIGK